MVLLPHLCNQLVLQLHLAIRNLFQQFLFLVNFRTNIVELVIGALLLHFILFLTAHIHMIILQLVLLYLSKSFVFERLKLQSGVVLERVLGVS